MLLSNVLHFDINHMHFHLPMDQQTGKDQGVGTGQEQEPTIIFGMSEEKLR